ncbi:MAG: carcinine hydrolase/isopenicillin-N N-acyltransferase family protein, partial [Myxococcaceae bacterium]
VDEADEADFPYQPSPHATALELPENVMFRFTLVDPDGVDPQTVRVTVDGKVYAFGDPALTTKTLVEDPTRLEATLTPAEPLAGPIVTVLVQAGDLNIQTDPPPAHAHFMRDERLAFTTRGSGLRKEDVWNRGDGSSKERAPAFAFAARGEMTSDGAPVLAHQFALLDGNTAHEHTVLFIHHPDSGPEFAVVGWAGIVWGMSGMNRDGLAMACNPSDTLDNSVVNGLFGQIADLSSAKLVASGTPIGIFARQVLEHDADVSGAIARAKDTKHTFGWNCLFADKAGGLRAMEVDSDFDKNGGVFDVGPEDSDSTGARLASVSGNDLRIASHFRWNEADIPSFTVAGQRVQPQRAYSSFYFRSLAAWARVGDELSDRRGRMNADAAIEILRIPALVDQSDSMNAVVYEPQQLRMRVAMGTEPATDSDFQTFSFEDEGVTAR